MPANQPPRSHSLRTGRFSEPGRVYLLTAVLQAREPLLADLHLARLLVYELRGAHEQGLASFLAWVVMPDHLHWLLRLGDGNLDALMRRVKARSALAISHRRGRTGPLWQDGYHDHALRHEDDIKALARYVLANPLRAGLVERLGDYPLWDAVWL